MPRAASRLAPRFLLLCAIAARAQAGTLEPRRLHLSFGGEWSAAMAAAERGYFNFTDYSSSTLRQSRLTLGAELRRGDRLGLVAELRAIDLDAPVVSALYLRARPLRRRGFDVQAGRIPPVFGSFARRGYGSGNLLVGLPLAYQYLTTLRADALPRSADELLRWRGGGWRPGYAPGAQAGLPLVHGELWDTGVQVRLGSPTAWQLAAALTQGTLSRPRVRDDNRAKQLSARVSRRFGHAWGAGVSAARGAYRARGAQGGAAQADDAQTALGVDLEYARGHVLLRAEAVWSAWDVPTVRAQPLAALGVSVEGRWRATAVFDLAARVDRLDFETLQGSTRRAPWDAPVWRLETGLGARVRRGLGLKLALQHNRRDGGYVRRETLVVARVEVRF